MVKAWGKYGSARLFMLRDDQGTIWLWAKIYAAIHFTKVLFQFDDSPIFTGQSNVLFYPLQWTRICLSLETNISLVRLVVDGVLLVEKKVEVKGKPDNLNLFLGIYKSNTEYPGQTTDLNIFSSVHGSLKVVSMEETSLVKTQNVLESKLSLILS